MNINHITFSVSDLDRSIEFYKNVLGAKLLVHGKALAYFDLGGVWLALNVEKNIPRNDIHYSYTHMAFSVTEAELEQLEQKLKKLEVNVLEGRGRDTREGLSLYFTDPDGHKFEFHTGSLEKRIHFYKDQNRDMEFYE